MLPFPAGLGVFRPRCQCQGACQEALENPAAKLLQGLVRHLLRRLVTEVRLE